MRKNVSVTAEPPPAAALSQLGLWSESCHFWQVCDHVLSSRIREDCLLLYCVGGSGVYRAGSRSFRVTAGDIFAVHPGVEHGYRCDSGGWDIWFVHFDGDQAVRLLDWIGFSLSQPIMRIGVVANLVAAFSRLSRVSQSHAVHYDIDGFILLYELFGVLKKAVRQISVSDDVLERSVMGGCESVSQMAARAGLSKYHFIRKFRFAVGQTPWQYINCRRIVQAKSLLCEHDLSIHQIASRLGFRDANYFSRFFRKATGMTASSYRRHTGLW